MANERDEIRELITKRLVLRGFVPDDWKDVHELALDWSKSPGPEFDKWPTTTKAAKEMASHFSRSPDFFAMCLKETEKVVGLLALNRCEPDDRFDLGHVIHSDYQDNDIDLEALQATVGHIFTNLGFTSIITHNDPAHKAQLAPLREVGFTDDKESEQGTLVLTRTEWRRRSL